MPEVLTLPGGQIVIEEEMRVVPRCGSCFEPLFADSRWEAVCMAADHMVNEGDDRNRVLETVIDFMGLTLQAHPCVADIIEEEPEL